MNVNDVGMHFIRSEIVYGAICPPSQSPHLLHLLLRLCLNNAILSVCAVHLSLYGVYQLVHLLLYPAVVHYKAQLAHLYSLLGAGSTLNPATCTFLPETLPLRSYKSGSYIFRIGAHFLFEECHSILSS